MKMEMEEIVRENWKKLSMKIVKIIEENGKSLGEIGKKFKEKQNHELVNNIVLLCQC